MDLLQNSLLGDDDDEDDDDYIDNIIIKITFRYDRFRF
jgi:hypothetical protein